MPLELVRKDITKMNTDAVVNAANSGLLPGGGVCGAIFAAAGYDDLERACREWGHCPTGQSVITDGFALPARYIIHTVGPVWRGGAQGEPEQLRSCYRTSMELARRHNCRSIAFPLISSGIYGYPKAEALRIAVETIRDALSGQDDMQVSLLLFDRVLAALARESYPELCAQL